MAKDITDKNNQEKFYTTSKKSNILDREQLEYTGSKIFWSSTLGLSAVTIYVFLVYVVVQQIKK